MKISLVVAMADNGVIGRDNDLPWRLSSDLKRFKAMTLGHPIIMGRKCYQSIGKPLPGRDNIVVTRDIFYQPEGVSIVHSLEAAFVLARAQAEARSVEEICVIGGGEIYRQALASADLLHVTHVLADVDGDTFFPAIDPDVWKVACEEALPAGEKDQYPTRFVSYSRIL